MTDAQFDAAIVGAISDPTTKHLEPLIAEARWMRDRLRKPEAERLYPNEIEAIRSANLVIKASARVLGSHDHGSFHTVQCSVCAHALSEINRTSGEISAIVERASNG